nr:GNAT family N-acetyltransferase [Brachybacterium squillarum]
MGSSSRCRGCPHRSTVAGTREYVRGLARAAEAAHGKRAFGLWEGEDLVGYADDEPEITDGTVPGDVNLTYAVHARARGRGVAVAAVGLLVKNLARTGAGRAAILRIDPDNPASLRVAEKAGSPRVGEFLSTTDRHEDGTPARLLLLRRPQPPADHG